MDERALLLLGLLKGESQHGYQLSEFIEKNLARVTEMKKATAYAILERLGEAGYVSVHTEQEGNRPPRRVYSITPAGEAAFRHLLREYLARADLAPLPGDIAVMMLDHLPLPEALDGLRRRREQVQAQIALMQRAPRHLYSRGVDLAVEHRLLLLEADARWLGVVIDRLSSAE